MSKLAIGLFTDSKRAGEAVSELNKAGFTDQITVVAKDEDQQYIDTTVHQVKNESGDATAGGAITGTILGGIIGFFVGASAIAVPGGVVVLGTLATTLIGMGGGATIGALTGALVERGVPEEQVTIFSDRLQAGDVAVVAEVDDDKVDEVEEIMENYNVQLLEIYA